MKKAVSLIIASLLLLSPVFSISTTAENKAENDNNLNFTQRTTPVMGWSSWNFFQTNISEEIIIRQMNAIKETGLYDCGYNFVNIDDGWQNGRENGVVKEKYRFWPNGMKYIADYAHANGFYAGIYTDGGDTTCGWQDDEFTTDKHVGLYGYEKSDLERYLVEWGFDFIKVDWCGGSSLGLDVRSQYTKIGNIIKKIEEKTGKDKIYNICCWHFPGEWVTRTADSWRIYGDIAPTFDSVLLQIDAVKSITQYTSPGHVNDLDMLQVGNGMGYEEDKTHFSMWCMMSAPLLIGCDVSSISDDALEILSNKELIAINQDPACLSANMVYENKEKGYEIWVKQLGADGGNTKAVAILNRSNKELNIDLDFSAIGLNGVSSARDLWEHMDIPVFDGTLKITVPAHGTDVYKVTATPDIKNNFILSGSVKPAGKEVNLSDEGRANWLLFERGVRKAGAKAISNTVSGEKVSSPYKFTWSDGDSEKTGNTGFGIKTDGEFIISLPAANSKSVARLYFSAEGDIKINAADFDKTNATTFKCDGKTLYVYELVYQCPGSGEIAVSIPVGKNIALYAVTLVKHDEFDIVCEITSPDGEYNISELGEYDWIVFGKKHYRKGVFNLMIGEDTDNKISNTDSSTVIKWTSNGVDMSETKIWRIKNKATLYFNPSQDTRTAYVLAGSNTGLEIEAKYDGISAKKIAAGKGLWLISLEYKATKQRMISLDLVSEGDVYLGFACLGGPVAGVDGITNVTEFNGDNLNLKPAGSVSATTAGKTTVVQLPGCVNTAAYDIYIKTTDTFIYAGILGHDTRQYTLNGNPYKKIRVYHTGLEYLSVMLTGNVEVLGYEVVENTPFLDAFAEAKNGLSVTATVDGVTSGRLIAAIYSPEGDMIDYRETSLTGKTHTFVFEGRENTPCTVRVFLWDNNNTPVTDSVELEYTPDVLTQSVEKAVIGTLKAHALAENGAILLDVRTKAEFEKDAITGSINIPHNQIVTLVKEYVKDKSKPVIVYCSAFKRSVQAYRTLVYLGYENVYILGSIDNWNRQYSVEFVPKDTTLIREGDTIEVKTVGLENEEYEIWFECNGYKEKAKNFKMPKQDSLFVTVSAYIKYGEYEEKAAEKEFVYFEEDFIDVYASDLTWGQNISGWGTTKRDKSVDGNILSVGGVKYQKGIGTHATSKITLSIPDGARYFIAVAGYDDEVNIGNVKCKMVFTVEIDGEIVETSGVLITGQSHTFAIEIPSFAKNITLLVDMSIDNNYYDHADWAIAGFITE